MKTLHQLREEAIASTIQAVKESVGQDDLIIQSIRSILDLTRAGNILVKRLRDWYAFHNPEFENACPDHQKFVETILAKPKKELLQELKVSHSMGKDLAKEDLESMLNLARSVKDLFELIKKQEAYLEQAMKLVCPNIQAVAGTLIGARLLDLAGSLRRLAMLPSSTIQLLGAEKALFRHIVTGAKSPKHGILILHPLVAQSKTKGRAARLVADKICMAARIDYFKGGFIGEKLKKELEEKLA